MGSYPVCYDGVNAGQMFAGREGMFLHLSYTGRKLPPDKYRMTVTDGIRSKDLGLCGNGTDGIHFDRFLPMRELPAGKIHFELVREVSAAVEIREDQPVPDISALMNARTVRENGVLYLRFDSVNDDQILRMHGNGETIIRT